MYRTFAALICLVFLASPLSAQNATFSMNVDGSARLLIQEAGQEVPTVYPLSAKAADYLISTSLEETISAEAQGFTSSLRFYGQEADVAVYQTALGMTAEQVALLAKKREEKNEASLDVARPLLEKVVQVDKFSPEEFSAFDKEYRQAMQFDLAREQAVLIEVLSPEQIQRMMELALVLPTLGSQILGDDDFSPFLNLDAYNALDLTKEQKERLAEIQKESGKEMADFMKNFLKEMRQNIAEGKTPTEEDLKAYMEKGKTLKARIKARVLALLTSEQAAKLEKLLAEWPKKLEQIKADWLAKEKEKKPEDDSWKNAWKPGDSLPEGAVPPKRARKAFPF